LSYTLNGIEARSRKELAKDLGIDESAVSAAKSATRGIPVHAAKKAGPMTGDKPATLYLTSQVAALKSKVEDGKASPSGILRSVESIVKGLGEFRDDELDRRDPDFWEAAQKLRIMAEAAMDFAGEKPVEAATKSASVNRDALGHRVEDPKTVERDAAGRRM
jgi:hypothetical protein